MELLSHPEGSGEGPGTSRCQYVYLCTGKASTLGGGRHRVQAEGPFPVLYSDAAGLSMDGQVTSRVQRVLSQFVELCNQLAARIVASTSVDVEPFYFQLQEEIVDFIF